MNYQSFQDLIIEQLDEHIPDPKKITIETFRRINGQISDGLIIMQNDVNIAPTIYLAPYYSQYKNGRRFSDILSDILEAYEKNRPTLSIDNSFFTDFSKIREHLVFKLVNYQLNETLLEDVPHFRFLDLAVIFYFLLFAEPTGNASILIHNKHLAYWDTTPEEIFSIAKENTPRLLPHELHRMSDILPGEAQEMQNELSMYVLTTSNNLNGACCMLYPNVIKDFSARMDCDFYILPSSIHEIILLPTDDCDSIEQLSHMVNHINEIEVAEEDILSSHAYYYSRKDDCISM